MYEQHWGLRQPPFRNLLDPRRYFPGAPHEEALARLNFLVEQHWRLGLLQGEAGSGKSLVLQVLASQLRRQGLAVAQLNLRGLDAREFLWRLSASIGLNPEVAPSPLGLWQQLDDQLTFFRYQQRKAVIILDGFETAARTVLPFVSRLVRLEALPGLRLSVIIAQPEQPRSSLTARDLLRLTDLRIELAPFTQDETEQFVQQALARAGCTRTVFTESGIVRLYELSQGLPRRVNQLAELALVAGAGQELHRIDAETVESVFLELTFADAAA